MSAIFSVGSPEIDQSFAFMSINNASNLLRMGNSISGIRIKYKDLLRLVIKLEMI
ncbi:MAG: hypothetical protein CM15mP86_06870 [Gammaproteobacteria bacterium]|nr:MAG: hypothetical protein CM15mP86_06870 [Gammaproteobacteria bacterium]